MKKPIARLATATLLLAAPMAARAADCAGNVDATGNECSSTAPTLRTSEGDIRKQETADAQARLATLRAAVRQGELKVAVARTTLIGAEGALEKAREALDDEERNQSRSH